MKPFDLSEESSHSLNTEIRSSLVYPASRTASVSSGASPFSSEATSDPSPSRLISITVSSASQYSTRLFLPPSPSGYS